MDRSPGATLAGYLLGLLLASLWLGLVGWLVSRGANGIIEDGSCSLVDGAYFALAAHIFMLGWKINTTGGGK